MRDLLIRTLVGLVLVTEASIASGEFYSGNKLLSMLQHSVRSSSGGGRLSNDEIVDASHANGYVAGVFDVYSGTKICAPSEVTVGQAAAIVHKFLLERPESLHFSADSLAVAALSRAFPCKK